MTYPADDQFRDEIITSVRPVEGGGWELGQDHTCLFCPKYEGEPKVGDTLRIYGKGFGFSFRGLYVNGVKVFYRTEEEDTEHHEIQMYGADAADWLKRWDDGRSVWSIEMGGLGPGYEQCIQIVAAETLRFLLKEKPDAQDVIDHWKDKWADIIEKALLADERLTGLGLSGAQAGAGTYLGTRLYLEGPRKIMQTPELKDRKIQVSRTFPQIGSPT